MSLASTAAAQPASAPIDAAAAPVAPAVAQAAAEPESPRFILRHAVFDGAQALTESDLAPAWAQFRDRPVRLSDLREIARRAEAIYARRGRPFVAVTVPPQDVQDGVVHLAVIEGRLGSVTILGQDPIARRQAAAAFGDVGAPGSGAGGGATDIDRLFASARKTPGLTVTGTLRRSDTPGAMDLVVQAQRRPWLVYANANNLIGDAVGPYGATLLAEYDGESPYGDRTNLQLFATTNGNEEVARLSHWRRLNASGTAVSGSLLYAHAEPQGVFAPLNLANEVFSAKIGAEQPVVREGGLTLTGGVGFEYYDQQLRRDAPLVDTQDHLRTITARLEAHYLGSARFDGSVEVRKGLDIGGASRRGDANLSRPGGDPQAIIVRGTASASTPKFGPLLFWGRIDSQYADAQLLSAEQYSAGNFTIGRGFEPGAIFGDRALGGSVEARLGPFAAGRFQVTPFAFYDNARVWSDGPFGDGRLSSAGGGLRADLPGRLRVEVTYAHRIDYEFGGAVANGSDSLLINLTVAISDMFAPPRMRR